MDDAPEQIEPEPTVPEPEWMEAQTLARLYGGELIPATIVTLLGSDQDLSDLP